MTPADRIHIYVGGPLRRLLDGRPDDPASHAINAVVERYQTIVARSIPALTEAEWMATADALNGVALWHEAGCLPWLEVADADRLNGLGAKWRVDAQALARRLHDAPYASVVAVIDVVERLWARVGDDWPTLLRAWGALPDDTVPRTGESTAPLTEDQVATLVELVGADRRDEYDGLCGALGVVNGPALWAGLQRRLGRRGRTE